MTAGKLFIKRGFIFRSQVWFFRMPWNRCEHSDYPSACDNIFSGIFLFAEITETAKFAPATINRAILVPLGGPSLAINNTIRKLANAIGVSL